MKKISPHCPVFWSSLPDPLWHIITLAGLVSKHCHNTSIMCMLRLLLTSSSHEMHSLCSFGVKVYCRRHLINIANAMVESAFADMNSEKCISSWPYLWQVKDFMHKRCTCSNSALCRLSWVINIISVCTTSLQLPSTTIYCKMSSCRAWYWVLCPGVYWRFINCILLTS